MRTLMLITTAVLSVTSIGAVLSQTTVAVDEDNNPKFKSPVMFP